MYLGRLLLQDTHHDTQKIVNKERNEPLWKTGVEMNVQDGVDLQLP
jgi:hypothetical protein